MFWTWDWAEMISLIKTLLIVGAFVFPFWATFMAVDMYRYRSKASAEAYRVKRDASRRSTERHQRSGRIDSYGP